MSASIDALIAERLGIPESQAQTLLQTMLKELRNRARKDGVRLPELGTFQEKNGTLSFTPSPSLRRLVNQEYEGLPSEDLSTAAGPDEEEDTSIPTILDRPQGESEPEPSSSEEPPERQPFPESEPADEGPPSPIMDEDTETEADEPSEQDFPFPDEEHESEYARSGRQPDEPEAERRGEPETEEEPAETEDEEDAEEEPRRSFWFDPTQLLVGVLLLGILAAGVWFVLDQTGVLSSPQRTEAMAPVLDTEASDQSDPSGTEGESAQASDQQQKSARFRGVPPGEEPDQDASDTATKRMATTTGRWAIVVASTSDRASAESVVDRYQNRFSDTSLSIRILEATVNNTTRYRVALGEYNSEASAEEAIDQYGAKLPGGAWSHQVR